jgi:hypothetical protein
MEDRGLALLAGVGVGAGLMYLFDPRLGRSRRAYVRDQAGSFLREAREGLDTLSRDVSNRASGLAAEARSRLTGEEVSDEVLCQRVRSYLGRVVSHPKAIEVTAQNGRVTVSGQVLGEEAARLVSGVRSVPGVKDVQDRLQVHQQAGRISDLQGGRSRPGERWELFQDNWSPTTRLLVALLGGGLLAYGFTQDAPWACVIGGVGLGMMASGITNQGVTDLLPEGPRQQLKDSLSGLAEVTW